MNLKNFKFSRSPKIFLVFGGLFILILAGAAQFFFNPLGLGPEPETVLSSDFFKTPAPDLSELELLVDGGEAFDRIFQLSIRLNLQFTCRPTYGKMTLPESRW